MEPYFNSIEEEREYLERRARRKKRMMLERKRRRRRRLIIQMALGLVVILAVIFTVVGAASKKVKADKAETAEKNQEAVTEQAEIYAEPIVEEPIEKPEPVVPETIAYEFVSTVVQVFNLLIGFFQIVGISSCILSKANEKIGTLNGSELIVVIPNSVVVFTSLPPASSISGVEYSE